MNRKILLFFLAFTAILCVAFGFTACGTTQNSETDGTENAATSETENGTTSENENNDTNEAEIEQAQYTEGLSYTLSEDKSFYYVSGIGTATSNDIVIANQIDGIHVTSIGDSAFSGCNSLTNITIPNNVTSIGNSAFYNCSGLTSITIGNAVASIGKYAFYGCTGLTKIKFNATECADLSKNNFIFYNVGQRIKVTIGSNVKKIPAYLFYPDTYSFTSIIISIEFENDSICQSIGSYAFYGCHMLISVTIPNSVTYIGSNILSYYNYSTNIYYKGIAEDWNKISIDSSNTYLTSATRYYYSETEPTESGNYWHYDTDGVTPVIWKKES